MTDVSILIWDISSPLTMFPNKIFVLPISTIVLTLIVK